MINYDLIHETYQVSNGIHLGWYYHIAVIILGIIIYCQTRPKNRLQKGIRPHHPIATAGVITAMTLTLGSLLVIGRGPEAMRWLLLGAVAVLGVGVLLEKRSLKRASIPPTQRFTVREAQAATVRGGVRARGNHQEIVEHEVEIEPPTRSQMEEYSRMLQSIAGMCMGALLFVGAMTAMPAVHITPSKVYEIGARETFHTEPTKVAQQASANGIEILNQRIEKRYDVEVVGYEGLHDDTHDQRVRLLDKVDTLDPWEAPTVRVTTSAGTYGEYRLTYDKESGQTTLLLKQSNRGEAVDPASLER